MKFVLVAAALAAGGIARFDGVRDLAAALKHTNAEFLIYFNNGNEVGLLERGTIVALNLESRLQAPGACCPHHATPSLSPDGRHIAYAHLKSTQPRREAVSVFDPESGKEQQVFEAEMVWSVSWSPDGRSLAVVADRTGDQSHNLYVVQGGSEAAIQLSHGSLDIGGAKYMVSNHAPPSWNPGGTQLAVELRPERAESNRASAIVIWDLATNDFHKLADGINPAWSPAQDLIAFFDPGARKCFTSRPDGSDQKLLFAMGQGSLKAQSATLFFPVVWSPDGKELLFHVWVDADMVTDIHRLELPSGKIHRLARTEVQVVNWRGGN